MTLISGIVTSFYPAKGVALCALSLSLCETLLLAAHEQGLWQHSGLPWHARGAMITVIFLTAASAGRLVYWILRALERLPRLPWLGAAISCAGGAVFAVLSFGYAASWFLMWRTGMFADWDAIMFAVRNLRMLRAYLLQSEPAGALALAIVSTTAACIAVTTTYRRVGPHGAKRPTPQSIRKSVSFKHHPN